jgi:O-antigen ligase/predicted flap endonuclease-1-like 5' DNA nuclease
MAAKAPTLAELLERKLPVTPKLMGIFLAIMALSPEMKFRVRSAAEAFGGGVDLQVMVELAIWTSIGAWALLHLARGVGKGKYSFGRMGAPMITVLVFWMLAVMTGGMALSVRSLVRVFQLTMLVSTILLLYWESRRDPEFFRTSYRWFRRVFVITVLGSMAASAALNAVFRVWPVHIDVDGFSRYRFFYVHPISVGGMAGMSLVFLGGMIMGERDMPRKAWMRAGMWLGMGALAAAVVATRSRGSLAGALMAAAVLVFLSNHRRVKVLATMGGIASILGLIGYAATPAGSEAFTRLLTRGQTTDQLLSLSQRTDLFEIAGDLFADRPIFGYGYFMPGPIFSTFFEWAGHGHNIFVEMAVAMGTIGLIVLVLLMVVPVIQLYQAKASRQVSSYTAMIAEFAALYVLLQAMGVIGPGISGSVAYEASVFMMFAVYADLYRADTRYYRRPAPSWRTPAGPDLDAELVELLESAGPTPDSPPGATLTVADAPTKRLGLVQRTERDDLQLIKGIGPKISQVLYDAGIDTFEQLSEMTPDEIRAVLRRVSVRRFILARPESWPDQARMAVIARDVRNRASR